MDVLAEFSDDQVALMGCFAALVCSGAVMSLSYYLGGHARGKSQVPHLSAAGEETRARVLKMPANSKRSKRKAA